MPNQVKLLELSLLTEKKTGTQMAKIWELKVPNMNNIKN